MDTFEVLTASFLSRQAYSQLREADFNCISCTGVSWKRDIHPRLSMWKHLYCEASDAMGFCCYDESKKTAWITFTGTESLVDLSLAVFVSKVTPAFMANGGYPDAMVHRGFFLQYSSLANDVIQYVDGLPEGTRISVTGHSLGGALAVLCSTHLALCRGDLYVSCVTFGMPRVGNPAFADAVDRVLQRNVRVVAGIDPVIALPTRLRWKHCGDEYKYEDKERTIIDRKDADGFLSSQWFPRNIFLLPSHLPMNYINMIAKFHEEERS